MAKKDPLQTEWKKVMRREQKALATKKDNPLQQKLQPIADRIGEAIPEKVMATTEAAFAKGFAVVFEQGTGMIEKTFNKDKRKAAHYAGSALQNEGAVRQSIRTMDRSARQSVWSNKALTTAEGGILGIFGIGIPDIPVYVGVLLKTVYEIALSYGYGYQEDNEQIFVLSIISMAATENEERERYSARTDKIGKLIDEKQPVPVDKNALIEETSQLLTGRLLTAKFVQGLPVVGVVGAATNYTFLSQLSQAAEIKYKKRYLRKVQRDLV